MLATLATEMIEAIADMIDSQGTLVSLSRTSRRFHEIIDKRIIPYNIEHCRCSGLRWAAAHNNIPLAKQFLAQPNVDIHSTELDFIRFTGRSLSSPSPEFLQAGHRGGFDTPFWIAMRRGHEDLAILLLENGADAESLNWAGQQSPLTYSVHKGLASIVRKLIQQKVDAQPGFTIPILITAAQHGHAEVFKLILDDVASRYPESILFEQYVVVYIIRQSTVTSKTSSYLFFDTRNDNLTQNTNN